MLYFLSFFDNENDFDYTICVSILFCFLKVMEINSVENFKLDADKYIQTTRDEILSRLEKFGRLYLEMEGETVKNMEASELIPGFPVDANKMIFQEIKDKIEILFCINADDIIKDSDFAMQDVSFAEYLETRLMVIERTYWAKPVLVINNIDIANMFDLVLNFERRFQKKQYRVFERYKILGYPYNMKSMLSENGFEEDDHIPLFKNLVLVMGPNGNCGKFSTCLGQMYLDSTIWIKSWYAKFAILPVANLPLDHSINVAYQEKIKDSGRELQLDENYKQKTWKDFVITNKDQECLEILKSLEKETEISLGYDCASEFVIN